MKNTELNRLQKWQQNGVYSSMSCLDIANTPTAFPRNFPSMDHKGQNSLGIYVKFWIITWLPRHTSLEFLYFQDTPVEILLGTIVWEPLVQIHFSVRNSRRNGQLFLIRLNWALWWTIWSQSSSSFKYSVDSLNYSRKNCHYLFNTYRCFIPP